MCLLITHVEFDKMWDLKILSGFLLLLLAQLAVSQQTSINDIRTTIGADLEHSYETFTDWGKQTTCQQPFLILYPRTSQQVASIVNWAHQEGKNVRVQGHKHSSSPLVVTERDDPSSIIILDLTRHMKRLRVGSMMVTNGSSVTNLNTIIAEAGASLDDFFTFSEQNDFSMVMAPSIGDATIGGILAVGGHGGGIPAQHEKLKDRGSGYTFGSMSNSITKFEAIVWDENENRYKAKIFTRSDPDAAAFLVHLGRAIITQVTLLVGNNYNMRCVGRVDIPGKELFAHPRNSSGLRTMSSFLAEYGRVDAIWFPFVDSPYINICEIAKTKPPGSRLVRQPYNYQFRSTLDNPQTQGQVFGQESMDNLVKGLTEDRAWDIWGLSKNVILSYNRTSCPLVYSGFVVLTNRANIQYVLHDITDFYMSLLNEYDSRGQYPIDQNIKFRITGLDDPREIPIPGAVSPDISATSPIRTRPDLNVGVWLNMLTTTRRPHSQEFMKRFEDFAFIRFNGRDALARPEWSKNWGHSNTAPFINPTFLKETIPEVFGVEKWNHAVETLDKHDPHHIITNSFLRDLLVPFQGSQLSRSRYAQKYGLGRGKNK